MLLTQILGFPSFVLGVLILYWSLPLTVIQGRCKFWKLYGKRDDAYGWWVSPCRQDNPVHCQCYGTELGVCRGKALQVMFGIKMLVLPGEQLYKKPCFYLVSLP